MKQSKKVIDFIQKECKRYCKQIGIQEPHLIFSDSDLRKATADAREFRDAKRSTLGLSWHRRDTGFDHDIIYLNLKNTDYIAQLIQTLIHELVHLRFPNSRHETDSFNDRINGITMGDKFQ